MKINDMITQLSTLGKRKTPELIWKSILFYYGSIMLNKYRYKKTIGSNKHIRYYSIVFANSGIGKALTLNEKVLTPKGYVENRKIRVGDYVIGSDGKPKIVDDVFEQHNRVIYKVTFIDGTSNRCDEDHLWTFSTDSEKNITEPVKYMLDRKDTLYIPYSSESIKYNSKYRPKFDIAKYGKLLYLIDNNYSKSKAYTELNILNYEIYDNELLNYGYISDELLYSQDNYRISLFLNIMQHYDFKFNNKKNEYSIKFNNKNFLERFVELGRSIGEIIKIDYENTSAILMEKHHLGKEIVSIERDGIEDTKCIHIKSKDSLYVIDGFNLTHNTWSMNQVEKMFDFEGYAKSMSKFYEKSLAMLPEKTQEEDENKRYMPKSVTIGVEGTAEGLFQVIKAQNASGFGSINLFTDELGEAIGTSSGLLSKLKELYDGTFKSKIIKGNENGEMKSDINNIVCNFIGLGSSKGVTSESAKELNRIATSGLFRRTFIIDSKEYVSKNQVDTDVEKLKEYIEFINNNYKELFLIRIQDNIFKEEYINVSECFKERLEEIDDELIENANNNKLNEFAQYDTGSLEMIIDLAHIVAFLECDNEVTKYHIDYAFDFFKETRATVDDTFKSLHPHKVMYDLLMMKDNLTISEMAEYSDSIPTTKTKINDSIALLEEICYRKDKVLKKNDGKVTRYSIENLQDTDLNKLIISTCDDNKGKFSIDFKPWETSFNTIVKLVSSKNIESFTACHYEPSEKVRYGHRKRDNFIEGQNIIVFDIDTGMTLDEAKTLLDDYMYIIYTTKSHQKEKNGETCDRFRVIIPTRTKFYVSEPMYKRFYENIEMTLGFDYNDPATRNVSRLFYTNSEAEVFVNNGILFDASVCIPNTEKSEIFIPKIKELDSYDHDDDTEKRIYGMAKYVLINTSVGNRNSMLHRFLKFITDIGVSDVENRLISLNSKLIEPLDDSEIRQMIRSHVR